MSNQEILLPSTLGEYVIDITSNPLIIGFGLLSITLFLYWLPKLLKGHANTRKAIQAFKKEFFSGKTNKEISANKLDQETIQRIQNNILEDHMDEISKKIGLSRQWQDLKSSMFWYSDKPFPVVDNSVLNTVFSTNSIIEQFLSSRIERKAPIFTAIGVLGTFLGIVIGVASASKGLASPDIEIARASMSNLLSGAELAFITSIIGVLLSTIYSVVSERSRDVTSKKIEKLRSQLSEIIVPRSGGLSAASQVHALHESYLSQSDKMVNALSDIARNQRNLANEMQSIVGAVASLKDEDKEKNVISIFPTKKPTSKETEEEI